MGGGFSQLVGGGLSQLVGGGLSRLVGVGLSQLLEGWRREVGPQLSCNTTFDNIRCICVLLFLYAQY